VEKRIERSQKLLKSGDKKVQAEIEVLQRLIKVLGDAVPARRAGFSDDEKLLLRDLNLLTLKPVLYVTNVNEDEIADAEANPYVQKVRAFAAEENAEVIAVCAKLESEIAELADDEAKAFLADLGLAESGLDKLIRVGFKLLGLMTFLTAGEQEVRAWTIVRGTKAPQAAGKIHSDIERGFIRAEIVSFNDLMKAGSQNAAREQGLVRLEGKEYIMQDGDVTYFRFNV
jgi:GTP-binding protein YchF